jgi:ribosomal protein S10
MFFYLKISCKDKRILKNFLRFFAKLESLPVFVKPLPKHRKRKFVTVLKSPHVNKTAQEQFEYRLYSKHFLISSFKPFTFFLLLKKLKNLSFSGINMEVKGFLENPKMQKHVLRVVNPDNLLLNKKRFKQISKSPDSDFLLHKKYVQLFDLYGEICLKKSFYSQ